MTLTEELTNFIMFLIERDGVVAGSGDYERMAIESGLYASRQLVENCLLSLEDNGIIVRTGYKTPRFKPAD